MSNPQDQPSPVTVKLEELRRRLARGQEVVVDQSGRLLTPEERKETEGTNPGEKTTLKTQRWF